MSAEIKYSKIISILIIISVIVVSCKSDPKTPDQADREENLAGNWILESAGGELQAVPLFRPGTRACISMLENRELQLWDLNDAGNREFYPKGAWNLKGDTLVFDLASADDMQMVITSISGNVMEGELEVIFPSHRLKGPVIFNKKFD